MRIGGAADVQCGVHRLAGEGRCCIANQRHMVSQFHTDATRGLDAGISNHPDDDKFLVTMAPEQMVQIRVWETTRTPMLLDEDIVRLELEIVVKGASPRIFREDLVLVPRLLIRGRVFPTFVLEWLRSLVGYKEDP